MKNIYYQGFKARDQLIQLAAQDANENGWSQCTSNKKRKMCCESKFVGSVPWMRSWAEMDHDVLTCVRVAGNMDCRLKYEKMLAVGKLIENVGCNLMFGYQRSYRIVTVAPRDVYLYAFVDVL